MKLSFVIPAYNEEKGIAKTLDEIKETSKKLLDKKIIDDFEVIVVDNNSKDRTKELAKSKGVRVLTEKKQGYGAAYKTGLKNATGDIIITGDGDNSYPFCDAERLLKELQDCDFITTNRLAGLLEGSMPILNHIGNKILTFVFQLLYNHKIKDSQSGMWAFRKDFLDELNFDLMSDGMPFSQQIKIVAISAKKQIKEIPIIYRKRIGFKKLRNLRDGFDNLNQLIWFKFKLHKVNKKNNNV